MNYSRRSTSSPLENMTGSSLQVTKTAHRHNKGLVLIAVYKLLQALLFVAIGVGALRLLHKDVDDILYRVASDLRFNPEGRFVNFIVDRASLLNDPILRRIGFAAFCYAGIAILEAIGLYLEKAWGEYLTLIITASFLPIEVLEILRRNTWPRVGLLIVNIVVLIYLGKLVIERQRQPRAAESEADPG
ncbi:MAG TPA: DUF2127 domain-containing protein [Terracidiphilus sp.]|jgi:uncharacterized membrane protein (DUF2068 family)|nr:DUF2127 domain-containing protein [Terracidiphilus sp.]